MSKPIIEIVDPAFPQYLKRVYVYERRRIYEIGLVIDPDFGFRICIAYPQKLLKKLSFELSPNLYYMGIQLVAEHRGLTLIPT